VWPSAAADDAAAQRLLTHATAVVAGDRPPMPDRVCEAVPIRIGRQVVGIVAALGEHAPAPDQRSWLEAAAAATAVTALIRESQDGDAEEATRALLHSLAISQPADTAALIAQAQRLGCDLTAGAVAICAERYGAAAHAGYVDVPAPAGVLLAEVSAGRVLALVPRGPGSAEPGALIATLRAAGMRVTCSLAHPDPGTLHEALREAEVLLSLAAEPDAMLSSQEDTYRLLIRVLLRDPGELEQLRTRTISALERYDAEHDTELLATLRAFLAHHGSTTETAEAMSLHRHTVGYRLTRVQEVSGLSPYESDGRERLSLGLKAHRILEAGSGRAGRSP
jgi:sugar diacid utilization regulator